MCLTAALINANTEAMKGNMEGDSDSDEQPLLSLSKTSGSLFYPNSTLSLRTPDTNAGEAESQMVSGCCALPPTDLHSSCPHLNDVFSASNFETLISAVWPSSDEARLRRRLRVIGWISDADISLSSGITEATSAAAGKGGVRPHAHRLTPSEIRIPPVQNLTSWIFKTLFLKMCFPYLVSILLMKKKRKTCFFSSRTLAPRGVNGFPLSSVLIWISLFCSKIITS